MMASQNTATPTTNMDCPPAFDRAAIRSHFEMLHRLACGQNRIIPLCVFGEDPITGRKVISTVQHFKVGDVSGMTDAAIAYENHPHANIYAPLAVMRPDLPRGDKGSERDVTAVLGALVIEPEFARVLAVAERHGSILSSVIRQAWDSGKLSLTASQSFRS